MNKDVYTINSKGQLVIPARIWRKYGVRKGTRVALRQDETRIILQPLTREYIRSLRGLLKGEPSILDFLIRSRREKR